VFDYCVNGDELQLSEIDGPVLTLTRAFAIANPAECSDRTTADCERAGQCRVGACVGGAMCDSAQRLEDCTNRQGCSWDAGVCVGDAGDVCELRHFGRVTGCELVESEPRCAGTRTPCPELDGDACSRAAGCSLTEGCTGGAVNCSALSGACNSCSNVNGCNYCEAGGPGTCVGTSTCVAQSTETACGLVATYGMGFCQWVESVCRGNPTPCEELDVDACTDTPGCEIAYPEE
jgi:hypothetical protein